MKQKIYLITGLMASGKSTVSDLLAKSIEKCVHLRGDVFRKMIISGRENMSATYQRKQSASCTFDTN